MNNQSNADEALTYMKEITCHFWNKEQEFMDDGIDYFKYLGTRLTPEKAAMLIKSLAKCQCCSRHIKSKSITFNRWDLAEVKDINIECGLNNHCKCPCRHNGRMINLAHVYIINKFD